MRLKSVLNAFRFIALGRKGSIGPVPGQTLLSAALHATMCRLNCITHGLFKFHAQYFEHSFGRA